MGLLSGLKRRARDLEAETYALYLAARDPRTPWYAKVLVAAVVAYGLSPIDLIPDFLPVIGYLDDLVLIPLGLAAARRLVPRDVLEDCRRRAREAGESRGPASRIAAVIVVVIWLVAAALVAAWAYRAWAAR
jgi:uncharacterized membrane protein YkvA (DUF1232 family)